MGRFGEPASFLGSKNFRFLGGTRLHSEAGSITDADEGKWGASPLLPREVPIRGGISETRGGGTKGCGFLMGLDRLLLVILEAFSSLDDSVICILSSLLKRSCPGDGG